MLPFTHREGKVFVSPKHRMLKISTVFVEASVSGQTLDTEQRPVSESAALQDCTLTNIVEDND